MPKAVVYTGCIGNDHFGEILQEKIGEVGVHTLYQHTDEQQTGTCAVLITGKNRYLHEFYFKTFSYFYRKSVCSLLPIEVM